MSCKAWLTPKIKKLRFIIDLAGSLANDYEDRKDPCMLGFSYWFTFKILCWRFLYVSRGRDCYDADKKQVPFYGRSSGSNETRGLEDNPVAAVGLDINDDLYFLV